MCCPGGFSVSVVNLQVPYWLEGKSSKQVEVAQGAKDLVWDPPMKGGPGH